MQRRCFSFTRLVPAPSSDSTQVEDLFAKPSWSVSSLLPTEGTLHDLPKITSKQLFHLCRLSALPPPKDQAEEDKALRNLSSQLHFVNQIQSVNTTGVEPLRSLRDETAAGRKEAEIGLDALKDALGREDVIGVFHKRIRRRRDQSSSSPHKNWDVLGNAEKKVGRFFVVEGGKD